MLSAITWENLLQAASRSHVPWGESALFQKEEEVVSIPKKVMTQNTEGTTIKEHA